jgi:hypothetical protein
MCKILWYKYIFLNWKKTQTVPKLRLLWACVVCPELYFSFLFVFGWWFFRRNEASFMIRSLEVAFSRPMLMIRDKMSAGLDLAELENFINNKLWLLNYWLNLWQSLWFFLTCITKSSINPYAKLTNQGILVM